MPSAKKIILSYLHQSNQIIVFPLYKWTPAKGASEEAKVAQITLLILVIFYKESFLKNIYFVQ